MLKSASTHNPGVTLLCNWVDLDDKVREMVTKAWGPDVLFFNIDNETWGGMFAYHKINQLTKMPLKDGDEVVMLDVDTMVQGSLFDVFESVFDIGYTSRPSLADDVPLWRRKVSHELPVNLGYTAFRWSDRVARFVDIWSLQIMSPTWSPYMWLMERYARVDSHCLCGDQDLICAIVLENHNPFVQVAFTDLTSKYNWFPDVDQKHHQEQAWEQIKPKLGDGNYRVIHLKGHLKPLASRIAEALCLL